jgi:hypothetical protein
MPELLGLLRKAHLSYINQPSKLREIIESFGPDELTVFVEPDYIDKQHSDSYYNYFSQKHHEYKRKCVRLIFFDGTIDRGAFANKELRDCFFDELLIGTIVLRPLITGNIGNVLLDPQKLAVRGYFRTCKYKVFLLGRKLTIRAFPFSTQDGESMVCAETVLFNLLRYYGEKYAEYRTMMPSEILKCVEDNSYQRVLPSNGIKIEYMCKVLSVARLFPRLYSVDSEVDARKELERICNLAYYYIESGIPFILGLPAHVVICVGHGRAAEINEEMLSNNDDCYKAGYYKESDGDGLERENVYYLNTAKLHRKLIIMDDNKNPYEEISIEKLANEYLEQMRKRDTGAANAASGEKEETHALGGRDNAVEHISILVPVYQRIYMDAAKAESIFCKCFLEKPRFIALLRKSCSIEHLGIKGNPIVFRMFLATARSYKAFKNMHTDNDKLQQFYTEEPLPRFIWVMEVTDIAHYKENRALAEIILDATATEHTPTQGILSVGLKKRLVFISQKTDVNEIDWRNRIFNFYDYDNAETVDGNAADTEMASGADTDYNNNASVFDIHLQKIYKKLYTSEYEPFPESFLMYNFNLGRDKHGGSAN